MSEKDNVSLQLIAESKKLHGSRLRDGGSLCIYILPFSRRIIEFYSVHYYTQSLVGWLGVNDEFKCVGEYRFYENFEIRPTEINISTDTPIEAVERMTNCLAPLLLIPPDNPHTSSTKD